MNLKYKFVFINSAILFVVAEILVMTLHEFGHFIASILVHARQISIHQNYTSNSSLGLSENDNLFIKAAGPLVSLMIGIIFHVLCKKAIRRNTLFLFKLYTCFFGYISFLGYLIIAPLTPSGDTGFVLYTLGLPVWVIIVISITSVFFLSFIINHLIHYFAEMATREIIEKERRLFVKYIILLPLITGLILTSLLNLPVPSWMSLIAPVCSPLAFFFGYDKALNQKLNASATEIEFKKFNRSNTVLIVMLTLTLNMNRFLVNGIFVN